MDKVKNGLKKKTKMMSLKKNLFVETRNISCTKSIFI